jgi:serine/threonine protein kinase
MPPVEQKPPRSRIGQVLQDKWRIERLVGEGGMASVYAARHRNGSVVAVKILHPEISQREDIRERFLLEARAANRVAHPGVVKVHDDNVAQDGAVFLVMELLEGETVLDRANRALVDPLELLRWMDDVLDVLAAAHSAGVVHRDLKPDNMFITTEGRVKVLDFGIARVTDALPRNFRTRTGVALGTGPYMSPEQAVGKLGAIDGRSDLFSVGATMFRLLTRRRVHEVDKESDLLMAMATLPAPPVGPLVPGLPGSIAAIIDRALAFLPSRRYPDARTMQADIREVLGGREPPHAMAQLAAGRNPGATHEVPSSRAAPAAQGVAPTIPGTASGDSRAAGSPPSAAVPPRRASSPVPTRAVPPTIPEGPSRAEPAPGVALPFERPSRSQVTRPASSRPPPPRPRPRTLRRAVAAGLVGFAVGFAAAAIGILARSPRGADVDRPEASRLVATSAPAHGAAPLTPASAKGVASPPATAATAGSKYAAPPGSARGPTAPATRPR